MLSEWVGGYAGMRIRPRGDYRERQTVPVRPGFIGLAGADADQQVNRRQRATRAHIENGRPLHSSPDGHRHDLTHKTDQERSGAI